MTMGILKKIIIQTLSATIMLNSVVFMAHAADTTVTFPTVTSRQYLSTTTKVGDIQVSNLNSGKEVVVTITSTPTNSLSTTDNSSGSVSYTIKYGPNENALQTIPADGKITISSNGSTGIWVTVNSSSAPIGEYTGKINYEAIIQSTT